MPQRFPSNKWSLLGRTFCHCAGPQHVLLHETIGCSNFSGVNSGTIYSKQLPRPQGPIPTPCTVPGCSTVSCRRESGQVRRACLELIHGLCQQKQQRDLIISCSPVQLQKSWKRFAEQCSELACEEVQVVTFMSSQWAPVAIGSKTVPIQDLHTWWDLERKKEKFGNRG